VDEPFPTPEEAAKGSDPDARVLFVDHSPNGAFAIAFLEYNPGVPADALRGALREI